VTTSEYLLLYVFDFFACRNSAALQDSRDSTQVSLLVLPFLPLEANCLFFADILNQYSPEST
jgi:hypothetical protein